MSVTIAHSMPRVSLMLCLLVAGIFVLAGPAPDSLVYDRSAIGRGEVWRLLTGHLAHADTSHLVVNLLGLGLVGAVFERQPVYWVLLFVVSAAAIDVWLWFLRADIGSYCGLSGVLYGLLAAGLFACWRESRRRLLLAVIGAGAIAKLLLEVRLGSGLLDHTTWPVLPGAHVAGAAAGLAAVLLTRVKT